MHVRTKERVLIAENASDLHEDLPPKKKLVGRSEKFGRALTINNQFFLHGLIQNCPEPNKLPAAALLWVGKYVLSVAQVPSRVIDVLICEGSY